MEFYTSVKKLGNHILYRGIDSSGRRITDKFEYSPKLYVEDAKSDFPTFKNLFGVPLKQLPFSSIREANDWIKQYERIENFSIYGEKRFEYGYIGETFSSTIKYDISKLLTYTIDIETKLETNTGFPDPKFCREEISLITIHNSITGKMIGFGQNAYTRTLPNNWEYHECGTEVQLLKRFLNFWTNNYPDIVTHWNGRLFDMPYIYRRIAMILSEKDAKRLSPYNYVSEKMETIGDKDYYIYDIYGIESLDFLDLYKKFTYVTQENYKLDTIAFIELGENKVENPYDTFKQFYEKDWNLFVEYCFIDTELVVKLNNKLKLLELAITIAYLAKCNFSDVLSPVKTWEVIIYNRLLARNVITPITVAEKMTGEYGGGFVKEPLRGMQKWIMSFDVNSMYPHICMQFGISPESIVEGIRLSVTIDGMLNQEYDFSDILENYAITANGVMYKNDVKGILPELMEFYYNERVKVRKLMKLPEYLEQMSSLDNAQMAYKILINSLYGAAANKHFKYFDIRLAESITLTGQVAIQWVAKRINQYMNKICKTKDVDYIIAIDTDSNYISFEKFVEIYCQGKDDYQIAAMLDKVSKEKILPLIEEAFQEFSEYTKCNENKLKMGRENIGKTAFWTAKKKYAMAVVDQEGKIYNPPKMKVMGLEVVRSSTPKFVRDALKETIELMLTKDISHVRNYVKSFKDQFYDTHVDKIAFPRGVNNVEKYMDSVTLYSKGCPIQVRAAILHNRFVKENKLDNKYPYIVDGDKIKFVYLKMPNPMRENVIAWVGSFPTEMKYLDKYIDYDIMYKKVFLEPLKNMLDAVNWELEHKINLEDFF